jgi:hypothetical protein
VRVDGQNASFFRRASLDAGSARCGFVCDIGVSCSMRAKIGWRFRPSGLRRDADAAESVQMRMGTSNRTGRRARAGGSRGRRTKRAPPSGFRPRRPPSRDPAVENRGAPASARRAVPSEQSRQQWVNGFARSFAGQVVPADTTTSWDSTLERGTFPLRGARGHNPRHRLEMTREERGGGVLEGGANGS